MAKSLQCKVWDKLYPKLQEVKLASGHTVKKSAWNQKSSQSGWDIQKIDQTKPNDDLTNYKIIAPQQPNNQKQPEQIIQKPQAPKVQPEQRQPRQTPRTDTNQSRQENSTNNNQTRIAQKDKKDVHDEIWTRVFGDCDSGIDFCGRQVNRYTVGGHCDWDIDHIVPLSTGGTNNKANLQITHKQTNKEKADKLIFFTNGKLWQLLKNNRVAQALQNEYYNYDGCDYCIVEI